MQSRSAICTLFEGNYHYGVAALVNSLHKNGFKGIVYVGYKGLLPAWAKNVKEDDSLNWKGAGLLQISKELNIYFLPVETPRHLTNYKPAFMLALKPYIDKGLVYFDPDIVVKCNWIFFEEWINYGVALVQEIVWNNFSPAHPRRMQWQPVIKSLGKKTERKLYCLFNGGFCGLHINHFEFAEVWEQIIHNNIQNELFDSHHFTKALDKTNIFSSGDQDALNIAAMCCQSPLSDVGPEGMDFIPGGWLMSHATGSSKPWNKNFLLSTLKGFPPTLAEKAHWLNANGIIKTHRNTIIGIKKLFIKCASFVGRFYKRY